ncbi:MAG: RIP metalloprotease RseP [Deltaproteobacteria bacterium]|nr:RIP metalloprotease RseP [Deltaproteobacteria bacterium]
MIGDYVVPVIFLLSVLIFVHELGHFWAAKACGVRVLKFSIGFGSPIGFGRYRMCWVWGDTEYVVAWIPLGGFVKMLGENPDEEEGPEAQASPEQTLGAKALWQKLLIVSAGPLMNLILPVLIFVGMQWVGLPRPEAVVGLVEGSSPAAEVGVQAGDRIVSIDGEPVHWWSDIYDAVHAAAGRTLAFELETPQGEARGVSVPVVARAGVNAFGQSEEAGWIGIAHWRPSALVAIARPDAPAREAALRSGDRILEVAGEPVADWYAFAAAYAAAPPGIVELTLEREEEAERLELGVPALGSLEALGVMRASARITGISEDSPAAGAGLQAGDVIVAYDGEAITTFDSFALAVSSSGGESKSLSYLRDGVPHEVTIAAESMETERDLAGPRFRLGVIGASALVQGVTRTDRQRNPMVSVPRAVEMTVGITRMFLLGLSKLATGEVSRKNLAGPIGIAQMTGDAAKQGWVAFMRLMVLISINLGILNLLPIPILDGGQALLFLVESLKPTPLSLRAKLAFQQVGLTVLVMLMGLAFWNDLSRLWAQLMRSL